MSLVGDLGCGTGHLTSMLAPWVQRVIAVDASAAMLGQAKQRLAAAANVDFRAGELEALPVRDGELDAAVLSLVLHYAADPPSVLAEAARTLRPGGRLLLIDILPHGRVEYRQHMGHVWLGFPEEQIRPWLTQAGFTALRYRSLPADAVSHGPRLFAVVARTVPTSRT
jgi:ArsR family transcriptional regulator